MREESLSYLRLLGLVLWGKRPTTEELKEGAPLIPIRHSEHLKQTTKSLRESPPQSATEAVPQPAATGPTVETSLRQAEPTQPEQFLLSSEQETFSFRYEAIVLPPAIILYEITGKLELPQQEKEVLHSMLSKCGLTGTQSTCSLPWPPPFPLEEREDGDYAQEAYEGFLMSLVENNKCRWLIILGESKLPPQFLPAETIQLDSLRLLSQEPIRRKEAWSKLSSLRKSLIVS